MAGKALIKFTQGATTDLAGRAVVGVAGQEVVVSNNDNADVAFWRYVVLDSPLTSEFDASPAVPVSLAEGAFPDATFTPDVPGTYPIRLRTYADAAGTILLAEDVRDFIVPDSDGWKVPAAGSTDKTMNYGGQTKGWSTAVAGIFASIKTMIADAGGGGSFDPASPGSIGATTPNTVNSTLFVGSVFHFPEDADADFRFVNITPTDTATQGKGIAFRTQDAEAGTDAEASASGGNFDIYTGSADGNSTQNANGGDFEVFFGEPVNDGRGGLMRLNTWDPDTTGLEVTDGSSIKAVMTGREFAINNVTPKVLRLKPGTDYTTHVGDVVTLDAGRATVARVSVTDNSAFTLDLDFATVDTLDGRMMLVMIINRSGGVMGNVTFSSQFSQTGFVKPVSGSRAHAWFMWDDNTSHLVQVSPWVTVTG